MPAPALSRRSFLNVSAATLAAGAAGVLAEPVAAAAQSAGVKRADLPDLTIPDGYVHASTKPGLGCELDRDVLDKVLARVDT